VSHLPPRTVCAGDREIGVPCVQCGLELQAQEATAICQLCGSVHHQACWERAGGCSSYECSGVTATATDEGAGRIRITDADLAAADPLPVSRASWADDGTGADHAPAKKPWNRTSLWAFIIALLGIPLFGLVTGLVAIVLGCIALVLHTANRRGARFAVAAIVLGLADVLGWAAGLHYFFGAGRQVVVSLDDFTVDPESLRELPEHISRAMRANVLIQSRSGLGLMGTGIGSGVILRVSDGSALIVTNRHVIDPSHFDSDRSQPDGDEIGATVLVKALGQPETPGRVMWVAPHGVDLALISAAISSAEVQAAHWQRDTESTIGDPVFAIGNPHGLGWTHTAGDISQLRRQSRDTFDYRVIQTSAAINAGNSGGGLYNAAGMLLGINTWTQDKRFAEGLGFSIAFTALLDLVPDRFRLPDSSPEVQPEAP